MGHATDGNIGAKFDSVYTSVVDGKSHALGTILDANDGSKYMLVQAGATITKSDCVAITALGTAIAITTELATTGQPIGLAPVAAASAEFFWARVGGRMTGATVRVASGCAASVALYTSATAGVLDDSVTATEVLVSGIRTLTTFSSTTGDAGATCIATWMRGGNV